MSGLVGMLTLVALSYMLGELRAYSRCRQYQDYAISALKQAQKDMKQAKAVIGR